LQGRSAEIDCGSREALRRAEVSELRAPARRLGRASNARTGVPGDEQRSF